MQKGKILLLEWQRGYKSGKLDYIDFYTIKETNHYKSQYKNLIKDNMRKAIHGCKDDYDMVVIYWQGYIQGFTKG